MLMPTSQEAKMLRRAIRESGGRIEVVDDIAALNDAFAGILAELREQYVVGYYPSADRGDGQVARCQGARQSHGNGGTESRRLH